MASQDYPRLLRVTPAPAPEQSGTTDSPTDWEQYRGLLMRKADRWLSVQPWLRRKCEAADLVQETLAQAHRDAAKCRMFEGAQCLAWLLGILKHRMADVRRRYSDPKRNVERECGEMDGESLKSMLQAVPTDDPTPSSMCRRRETEEELADALRQLSEPKRQVLLQKYRDNMKYHEIAAAANISEDAARQMVSRSLEELRTHFNALRRERP